MTADAREFNVGSGVEFEGKVGLGLGSEGDGKENGDANGIACLVGVEKDGIRIGRSVAVENGNLDDSPGKDLDLDATVDPVTVGDQETSEGKEENGELTVDNGGNHDEGVVPVTKLAVSVADDCREKTPSSDVVREEQIIIESDSKRTVSEGGHAESDEQREDDMLSEKESDVKGGICEEKGEMCKKEVNVELNFENGQGHLEDNINPKASEDKNEVEVDSVVEVGEKQEGETSAKQMNLEEEMESAVEVEKNSETAVAAIDDQGNLESTIYDDEKQERKSIGIEADQQELSKSSAAEGDGQEAKTMLNGIYHQREQKTVDNVDEKQEIVTATTDVHQTDKDAPVVVEETKEPLSVPTAPNKLDQVGSVVLESQVSETTKDQGELDLGTEVEPRQKTVDNIDEKQEIVTDTTDADDQTDNVAPVVVEDAKECQSVPTAPNKRDQAESVVLESQASGTTKDQGELDLGTEVELEKKTVDNVDEKQEIVTAATDADDQTDKDALVVVEETTETQPVPTAPNKHDQAELVVLESQVSETTTDQGELDLGTEVELEQKTVDNVDDEQEIVTATTDADDQTDKDAPVVLETTEPQSVPTAPNNHDQAESVVLESQVSETTKDQGELDLGNEVELVKEPQTAVTDFVVDQAKLTSAVEVEKEQRPESLVTEILPSESSVDQKEMRLSNGSDILSTEEHLDENRTVPVVNSRTSLEAVDGSESSESQKAMSISDIDAGVNKAEAGGDPIETGDIMVIEHSDDLHPTEGSSNSGVPRVVDKEVLVELAIPRQELLDASDRSASCEVANPSEPEVGNSSAVDSCSPSVKSDSRVEKESVESNTSLVKSTEDEPSVDVDDNKEAVHAEAGVIEEIQVPMKDPSSSTLDGEKVDIPLGKPQACYIIRIPRFVDDQLSTKIQIAQSEVNEKTQRRDSVKVAIEKQKVTCNEFWKKFETSKSEERAARAAVTAKRQQIDSVQLMINKLKNVHSIEELDDKIQSMEFDLQHVTMPLKEEKKYIHELKQLRHQRDELTSNMGSKAEIDEAFDQKEQIDERFKILKKELDSLRTEVLRTEANANAARKKYDEEQQILKGLQQQFKDADAVRQKAYGHWRELRNMLIEKNKHFNMYKNDQKSAENYISSRDFEGLRLHCSNQVENVMTLWNNDKEFRMQYVKSNMNSTLRRLRTSDGRSLGPDEEPPVLHSNQGKGSGIPLPPAKINESVPPIASVEKVETPKEVDSFPALQAATRNQPVKPKKSGKPSSDETKETIVAIVSDREIEIYEKVSIQTKEEEELKKKAEELSKKEEELRKEKAAAKLKEQCRLEQMAKAKEAEERKRKQAEKAQARAEYRAQKEAELREKKRAKKQKKKGVAGEDTTVNGAEEGPAPSTESSPPETSQELDPPATTASKKPSRPVVAPKQYNKVQPIPLPLRKRGKRKMSTWMWVLLSVILVLLLFLAGNYISFSSFSIPQSGR